MFCVILIPSAGLTEILDLGALVQLKRKHMFEGGRSFEHLRYKNGPI